MSGRDGDGAAGAEDGLPPVYRRALLRQGTLTAGGLAIGGTETAIGRGRAGTATEAAGDTVYVGDESANLYALDAATGDQLWAFSEPTEPIRSAPTVVASTVYVGTGESITDAGGSVYAVDAQTGDPLWVFEEPTEAIQGGPTVVDGLVYAVAGDDGDASAGTGVVYALDAQSGTVEWTFTDDTGFLRPSPNVVDGTLFVGGWDPNAETGILYAVDAATGAEQWRFTGAPYPIVTSATATPDTVYVGSGQSTNDGIVHAIDRADGTEVWSVTDPGGGLESPTVVEGTVYVRSADGRLYAIDAETGSVAWTFENPDTFAFPIESSPTVADGMVVVGDFGHVYGIETTGDLAWTYAVEGYQIHSSPTVANGVVYIGSGKEVVHAIDLQDGSEVWTTLVDGAVESSPTVVADPSGGDSVGSRVALGTLGHHGEWAGQGLPDITGFHPVHVTGQLYGHTDPLPSEGVAGAWDDADVTTRTLVTDGSSTDLQVRTYAKIVGQDLYVGLHVPAAELEGTDALSAGQFERIALYLDRSGTDELSAGDARLVGESLTDSGDPASSIGWTFEVLQNGEFVEVTTDGNEFTPPALSNTSDLTDGGFGVETHLTGQALTELYDGSSPAGEFRLTAELRSGGATWGLGYDPTNLPSAYEIGGVGPSGDLTIPIDNSSVDRIEVTQAVQTTDNSLPLVRNKETLARVFVDHPESEAIEVDVQLEGYYPGYNDGFLKQLPESPLSETGFQAPPTPLDRADESHSANFELPASWSAVESLTLVARVNRPGHVDDGTETRWKTVSVDLQDTYDPTIWFGRVEKESTNDRPSKTTAEYVQRVFTETMPIADPTFVSYDSNALRGVAEDDNLIKLLDDEGQYVDAVFPGPVDQFYGLTQNYGGDGLAGLSSPSWTNGPSNHLAAWGDDPVTDSFYSTPTVMAHEVTHNVGGKDWALHCNADDDFADACEMGEVGWSPTLGILPASTDDLMKDQFSGNAPDPKFWVGRDRWKLLFDRFQNFVAGEPQPPGYGGPSTSASGAGTEQVESSSTMRVVSGALYPDGGGYLNPSFEAPGSTTEPAGDAADPTAYLEIEYPDSTLTIEFETSFESLHGETVEESAFSFTVPDDGAVEAVRLFDAATDDQLDAYAATDFQLESAAVETPGTFERDQEYEVTVDVQAQSGTTLFRRLLYSPDDGETWRPYSGTFTGDSQSVSFSDGPGGQSARFLLLVSDGIRTERVQSDPFTVPSLPPAVDITGANEFVVEDGEVQAVASPVGAVVGTDVTLRAGATDESGDSLTGDAIEWAIVDEAGESVPVDGSAVGEQFRHRFAATGSYTVTATASDPATGLSATDEITVEVGDPPLPDADAVKQFYDYGLQAYANDENVIETDGLRECLDDWRQGDVETDVLRDAIDAWRSGSPIE